MKTKSIQKIKEDYFEKFNNRIGSSFECCDAESLLEDVWNFIEKAISQSKEELVEEIKKTIENKKDDLIAQEKFCSNCIKERDEEDDELTGEIEPCQTHLISWFNIQTLEELLEKLSNK